MSNSGTELSVNYGEYQKLMIIVTGTYIGSSSVTKFLQAAVITILNDGGGTSKSFRVYIKCIPNVADTRIYNVTDGENPNNQPNSNVGKFNYSKSDNLVTINTVKLIGGRYPFL